MTRRSAPFRDPTERAANAELFLLQLDAVLRTLSEREQAVIRLRFGLVDGQPRTLDEIGQVYGVTRERIRQIEGKTLSKLRRSESDTLRWLNSEDWGNLDRLPDPVRERVLGRPVTRPQYEPVYCHLHGLIDWVERGLPRDPDTVCAQCACRVYQWTGGRPQRYCSGACRQAAYRKRKQPAKRQRGRHRTA